MRIESVTEKGACVLCMYDLAVTSPASNAAFF